MAKCGSNLHNNQLISKCFPIQKEGIQDTMFCLQPVSSYTRDSIWVIETFFKTFLAGSQNLVCTPLHPFRTPHIPKSNHIIFQFPRCIEGCTRDAEGCRNFNQILGQSKSKLLSSRVVQRFLAELKSNPCY